MKKEEALCRVYSILQSAFLSPILQKEGILSIKTGKINRKDCKNQ